MSSSGPENGRDTVTTKAPGITRGAAVMFLTAAGVAQFASNSVAAIVATIVLGAEQRGVMVLGATIGSVAAVAASGGTGTALRARLPVCLDPVDRGRLVSSYTWWTPVAIVLAALGTTAVSAASSPLIGPALASGTFLVAAGAFAAVQVLLLQTTEAWFADGDYRRGGTCAAAITAGGLGALLIAAAVADEAAVLLLAQSVGMALAWFLQVGSLRRAGLLITKRPRRGEIRALLGKGAPALGMTLGLAVALRADRYILGAVGGAAAVGVYSLAATLSEIPRLFPQTLGQLFMRDVAMGNERHRLTRWIVISVAATAVSGAVIAAVGWLVIVPVFGAQFSEAPRLLVLFVLAEMCFAPYAVASRGVLGGGWTRAAGAFGVCAAAVAVVCYLLGARLGGSTGLAVSCAVLYGLLSCASVALFRRRVRSVGEHDLDRGAR